MLARVAYSGYIWYVMQQFFDGNTAAVFSNTSGHVPTVEQEPQLR